MKNFTIKIAISIIFIVSLFACNEKQSTENPADINNDPGSFTLFNGILFYDGYAETVDEPVPTGIYRIANSKYVSKLTDENIKKIGDNLDMEIIVKAACDNYDRIGNVFLSLVNKGENYDVNNLVSTIELARFITPFMDKNKTPDQVPYNFEINNIAKILTDSEISSKYDFWIEFDIFGVPYAANAEISGCAGKNHTSYGTIKFTSSQKSENTSKQMYIPIASFEGFNNYKNTDVLGQTTRSFNVEIPSSINNAKLYVITSNHGSNYGGEEYNRRNHFIYFDGNLIDSYIPGGKSCEPYRQYNTQANGIYGSKPQTETEWASFSNWCPGDAIPIRIFDLGNLNSGNHIFKIEVPDAKFVGKQGDIPLSAYIQGDK
ncbi:MAG: hypothetical protein KKF62_10810 [Bacteroidetes bacterium]|nr:hypothetical protein [Bacteroidota bacterium]MBU1116960.1 hypothetical protein [Bacteroidota bacterium]MBU1799133.1 hypothetical protein [Bacteroidota bacterium]